MGRRVMQNNAQNNDLQEIISQALEELKKEEGDRFDLDNFTSFTAWYKALKYAAASCPGDIPDTLPSPASIIFHVPSVSSA